MQIGRVSILGVGLIGGSIGLACRRAHGDSTIISFSPVPEELQKAIACGAIDQSAPDAATAVTNADLVILCTPVGSFQNLLTAIAPALKPGVIVTDVGSTKRSIAQLADRILPSHAKFVGSHPMAGGEKHGIANARVDLLTGALCIITPTPSTDRDALNHVEKFWQSLGMRTVHMSPETHDAVTADMSHLPHAIAAALVRVQSAESLQLAGRGFLDSTRIAASDPALWRDILLDNRDNVQAGIARVQSELQVLQKCLETGDAVGVQNWLNTSAQARQRLNKS